MGMHQRKGLEPLQGFSGAVHRAIWEDNLAFWAFVCRNHSVYFLRFVLAQRALAALVAARFLEAGLIVRNRRFPPILPPFLPIFAL